MEDFGGLESLLNLRLLCSTTKRWIDNLPYRIAQEIFNKAYVKFVITTKNLKRFLKTPPPPQITSLAVENAGWVQLSPEESEMWEAFVEFWKPKITSLETTDGEDIIEFKAASHLLSMLPSTIPQGEDVKWQEPAEFLSCGTNQWRTITSTEYDGTCITAIYTFPFRHQTNFPTLLTYLHLGKLFTISPSGMINMFKLINERCPVLEKLKITWRDVSKDNCDFRDKYPLQISDERLLLAIKNKEVNIFRYYEFLSCQDTPYFKCKPCF